VVVRNIQPAVTGEVTVHAGEFTTVVRGLAPSAVQQYSVAALVKAMGATNVYAPPAGWHIGSLSDGALVETAVGVSFGATAVILIATLTGGGAVSPSRP
jgi:hypothetical protein